MSLSTASPGALRAGSHSLRTSAARTGLAGWRTGRTCGAVQQWQGVHGDAWRSRALQAVAAARTLEAVLRRLATEVELHARAVEVAQQRLRALDVEEDALSGRVAQDLARWQAVQGPERGARPDLVLARTWLSDRRRQVEDEAQADAQAFARRTDHVLAALAAPPSAESVLRAVLDSPAYTYGYALPSGVSGLAGAAAGALGRPLRSLPPAVRLPLRVVGAAGGALGVVSDGTTLVDPEHEGARGAADRAAAAAGLVSTGGGVVLALTGVAASPVVLGSLFVLGTGALVHGVVTLVHDALADRRAAGERRDRAVVRATVRAGVRDPRSSRRPATTTAGRPVLGPARPGAPALVAASPGVRASDSGKDPDRSSADGPRRTGPVRPRAAAG